MRSEISSSTTRVVDGTMVHIHLSTSTYQPRTIAEVATAVQAVLDALPGEAVDDVAKWGATTASAIDSLPRPTNIGNIGEPGGPLVMAVDADDVPAPAAG